MWKNPIFVYTYSRPFSHWNSNESNSHGHIVYYSPLLRGRFLGHLHDMQVYYATQIMGASIHASSTNLLHYLSYNRHRQTMGLHHSPSFHLVRLVALTTEVLKLFPAKGTTCYSYVNDVYLQIMQYENSTKRFRAQWNIVAVHNVIMNYANVTKSVHVQCNIDMTQRTTRHSKSNERHSLIAAHLRRRALPFDRGPTWSQSIPRGLKKKHSTCLFSMTLSGPERPRLHAMLDLVYTNQHLAKVYLPKRTLPFDRGPPESRSVQGERNLRHTQCLSSRSRPVKYTDSRLHQLQGVHLRRRALPFDRGPQRPHTTDGELLHQYFISTWNMYPYPSG